MKYRLRSIPQTDLDIEDAFNWYESERIGLGMEFLDQVRATYDRIEENPLKYQLQKWDIRRALTRRFPFAVYFIVDGDSIIVLGVMHAARDPERWQKRRKYRISEP